MPISYKLTPKQISIIQFIKSLKSFDDQKDKFRSEAKTSSDFQQKVESLISLSKYKGRLDLIAIAFDTEVPQKYVLDETEEIQNFRNPRAITKTKFVSFRDGCGADEYMFFRFHINPNNTFSLGYIKKNCVDADCTVRWFDTNTHPSNHGNDAKGKIGILHTKEEFGTLIANSGNNIYLHRRKYKNPINHKSEQTVVLTNASRISTEPTTDTFDNVGGSCCPPQF